MSADLSLVTSAATRAGIPPSVLYAVGMNSSGFNDSGVTADDKVGMFGIPMSTLQSYGFTADEVKGNPQLQAQLAARVLAQNYAQYGSWNQTLSAYRTGNPNSSDSATDPTGGWVTGVLGIAATQATMGLTGSGDIVSDHFAKMLGDLGQHMQTFADKGGVVTDAHIKQFQQVASKYQAPNPSIQGGTQGAVLGAGTFQGDIYPQGQCTWFAAGAAPWLSSAGNLGDAHNWLSAAQGKGLATGRQAQVGAVVVYGAGGGYDPQYGHVGVVTAVNSDGTFQVTSDHWGGLGQTHTGTSTMSDVTGFILPPSQEAGQATAQKATTLTGSPQRQIADRQASKAGAAGAKAGAEPSQAAKPQKQPPAGPPPQKVAQFAQDAQRHGVTPDHIKDNLEGFATTARYLGVNFDLQKFAQTMGMGQQQIADWLKQQPSTQAPTVQAGMYKQMFDMASLHSISAHRRYPTGSEVTKFANSNMGDTQVAAYYKSLPPEPATDDQNANPKANASKLRTE